jgi:ABC-type multidrug transport system ATPase subunit
VAIIELDHLTKRFDDIVAVDDLTLEIADGEFFGLLGPNGAGKTTTLLILTTLVRPTSGTARVTGFDLVPQASQVRRSIGIVFQDPSSDDTLTGYENLKLHGMLYGMAPALREQRIVEVLELVDLTNRKDSIVKHYSGGMRRRLELARGLMHRPKVLFLDEPTLGLDPQSRDHIWAYVERLGQRGVSADEGVMQAQAIVTPRVRVGLPSLERSTPRRPTRSSGRFPGRIALPTIHQRVSRSEPPPPRWRACWPDCARVGAPSRAG